MKRIVFICTCFLLLHSCVLNEEINQVMTEVASRSITATSEIPEEAFANVHVRIHNKMSDLYLKVQSIELCNIHQSATFHFPTDYQESRWTLQESQTDFPVHNDSLEIAPMDSVSFTQESGIPFTAVFGNHDIFGSADAESQHPSQQEQGLLHTHHVPNPARQQSHSITSSHSPLHASFTRTIQDDRHHAGNRRILV